MTIHYKETKYGFEYGAAAIERTISDDAKGWVYLTCKTPKSTLEIYVTRTGKIRVFDSQHREWKPQP